jgi:transcription elongation factor S-II
VRRQIEEMRREALDKSRMTFSGGTLTSNIKCKKCGKANVTYNQVQTRSGDEPMTTFCFCNECGFRWRF